MASGRTFLFAGLEANDLASSPMPRVPAGCVGWQSPCQCGALLIDRRINPIPMPKTSKKDFN